MERSKKIKTWAYLMRLGDRFGCHQREDRSFKIKDWQLPICSRCTGILTGQIIGLILYAVGVRISFLLAFVFLLVMFLDWFIQYRKIKESTNLRRFITGNLAGIAQVSIILNCIIYIVQWIGQAL